MKHLHADIIHAYADGAEIEGRPRDGGAWRVMIKPCFVEHWQYRVKPKPKTYRLWLSHGGTTLLWVSGGNVEQDHIENGFSFNRWLTEEIEYNDDV